jgi:hypothetical protein
LLKGSVRLTAAHAFLALFVWYAAVSLTWSANPYDGADALFKLVLIAQAFVLGAQLDSLRRPIIGFGLGIWISSLVILTGWQVPAATPNAGLFVNSNSMGEIAGLVLVAALFFRGEDTGQPWSIDRLVNGPRIWWLIPGILPALLLAQCRGAFVAVGGALFLWVWQRSRSLAIALGALGIGAVVLSGSIGSVHDRLTLWIDTLPQLTLLGRGLGSFYTLYPTFGSIDTLVQRPEHLHNDWLEMIFEVGFIGSVGFIGCAYCIIKGRCRMAAAILATLGIEAAFGFPLHMPATTILGGLVAGHAVRNRPVLWRGLDAGRTDVRRWVWAS